MDILLAMMLFMAPVDLAMLDLDMEPDIRVTLNAPAAGGAPATYRILAEDSSVLTAEDESPLRTE